MIRKIIVLSLFLFLSAGGKAQAHTWAGVDETVVEKFAEQQGRKAWKPFINTDQGDLLLFVFLLAGSAGGFVLGFNWRKLFCEAEPWGRSPGGHPCGKKSFGDKGVPPGNVPRKE